MRFALRKGLGRHILGVVALGLVVAGSALGPGEGAEARVSPGDTAGVAAAGNSQQVGNVIRVAAAGGDYFALSSALEAIADASPTKRYLVEVYGRIADPAPIRAKSYVDVVGYNADVAVDRPPELVRGYSPSALYFVNVTQSNWRDLTVRVTGPGDRFVLGMFGTVDSSVRFDNMRFINESSGGASGGAYIGDDVQAVFNNSYFKGSDKSSGNNNDGAVTSGRARPTFNGCIFEGGNGGGEGNTGFAAIMQSAPILNNSVFRGGTGDGAYGLRAEDQAAPVVNGGVAFGGKGTGSIGLGSIFAAAPVVNGLTVHYGEGVGARGIVIREMSSPIISNVLVAPEQLPQIWEYSPQSQGRFRPFDDKPYMLSTAMVWTKVDLPRGTTLRIGTKPGGKEAVADVDISGGPAIKEAPFSRVEARAGDYLYASASTPLAPGAFALFYVVIVNYPENDALTLQGSVGRPTINNSTFISNGASNALSLASKTTRTFEIRNSVFKTLDPQGQYALFVSELMERIPIYSSQFVGRTNRVSSFAISQAAGTNISVGPSEGGLAQKPPKLHAPRFGMPLLIVFVVAGIGLLVGLVILVSRLPGEEAQT